MDGNNNPGWIRNSIAIRQDNVEGLFAEVRANHPNDNGRWETEEEIQGHGKEYILPNGLKISNNLGDQWLEYIANN